MDVVFVTVLGERAHLVGVRVGVRVSVTVGVGVMVRVMVKVKVRVTVVLEAVFGSNMSPRSAACRWC